MKKYDLDLIRQLLKMPQCEYCEQRFYTEEILQMHYQRCPIRLRSINNKAWDYLKNYWKNKTNIKKPRTALSI